MDFIKIWIPKPVSLFLTQFFKLIVIRHEIQDLFINKQPKGILWSFFLTHLFMKSLIGLQPDVLMNIERLMISFIR